MIGPPLEVLEDGFPNFLSSKLTGSKKAMEPVLCESEIIQSEIMELDFLNVQ